MPHADQPNTDVDDEAVRDLLSQYQKPRIEALVRALIGDKGLKELEFDFSDLHDYHFLPDAEGEQLDQWGRIVGSVRGGLDDPEYSAFISARIQANFAEGRRNEMIEIMSKLPNVQEVRYYDHYPAGCLLSVLTDGTLSKIVRDRMLSLFNDIRPAGVHLDLIERGGTDDWFQLDTGNGHQLNQGKMSRVLP